MSKISPNQWSAVSYASSSGMIEANSIYSFFHHSEQKPIWCGRGLGCTVCEHYSIQSYMWLKKDSSINDLTCDLSFHNGILQLLLSPYWKRSGKQVWSIRQVTARRWDSWEPEVSRSYKKDLGWPWFWGWRLCWIDQYQWGLWNIVLCIINCGICCIVYFISLFITLWCVSWPY